MEILQVVDRFWLGFGIALFANIVIAISNTVRKKAVIRREYVPLENEDKYIHYKDWVLWVSVVLMLIAQAINFIAFSLAPAFLIAATGVIGIFLTAIMWKIFYGEIFNYVGFAGLIFSILGLAMMVLNYPKREITLTVSGLAALMDQTGLIYYVIAVVILYLLTACYIVPHFGTKCVSVYVIFSLVTYSFVGSVAIIFCKCAGYSIKYLIVTGNQEEANILYMLLFLLVSIVAVGIQEIYMAKFTNSFTSASTVKAIFFILRTALVAVFSDLLFSEWSQVRDLKIVGTSIGFVLISIGALLHPLFSDYSFDDAVIGDKFRPR